MRLFPVIIALGGQWGTEHLFEPTEAVTRTTDVRNGKPLTRIAVMSSDGRELGLDDTISTIR